MRRLRVGFPPQVYDFLPSTGTGKMWHTTLPHLSHLVDLRCVDVQSFRGRARYLLSTRPDVWIHDGHHGPLTVRQPVVTELHEAAWQHPETRQHMDSGFVERYELLAARAARAATAIVTLSESSKRQIVGAYGVDEGDVFVAPLGVDRDIYHPDVAKPTALLRSVGGDPERPYVLFVSQLHGRKNLSALRSAMTRLAGRGFPHQLVIVGDSPTDRPHDEEIVRAAVADLPGTVGRVVHLRRLSDAELAQVMAGAAAFCLPSLMEGFGLTALEAMSCGAPVVVSDRGALPEVVGDAGLVVPPDEDALEAALEKILSDTAVADSLRSAGIARSRQFTWEATARRWWRSLEAAAASAR